MSTDPYGYTPSTKPQRQDDCGNLSGTFALDRIEFPIFYVPISPVNSHNFSTNTVFTETSTHHISDWLTLGIVSKDSPLGQGTYCGFKRSEVKPADIFQIVHAVLSEHPHSAIFKGPFRPGCRELQDASFHLTMSTAFSNWTTDNATFQDPAIIPVSSEDISDFAEVARLRYNEMMNRWGAITQAQTDHILDQLEHVDLPQQ